MELPFGVLEEEANAIIEKQVFYDSESGKIRYLELYMKK
jgi:hypothetical protein